MEILVILSSIVILFFIIYSAYASRSSQYEQRLKAFELKAMHMNKSMDKLKDEISILESEYEHIQLMYQEIKEVQ